MVFLSGSSTTTIKQIDELNEVVEKVENNLIIRENQPRYKKKTLNA